MRVLSIIVGLAVSLAVSVTAAQARDYYVSPSGNDSNTGTTAAPWRTIARVNAATLIAGDRVLFQAGQVFVGTLYLDASDSGTASQPIVITSYGSGRATINGGTSAGVYAYNTAGITVDMLSVSGGSGNNAPGIMFYADLPGDVTFDTVTVSNVEVSGFGNYGVVIGAWNGLTGYTNVRVANVSLHGNTLGGLQTYGDTSAAGHPIRNVVVTRAQVYGNPGAAGTNSPDGSGIVLGQVDHGSVEHCVVYNNGALTTSGSGPVGIWTWGANDITIQYNESHHNQTSGTDGGGFDLDGGTTNSVVQYNYAHDNDGAGFLLAGYPGAAPNTGNVIRYNISQNDGRKTINGGIYVWDGAGNMSGNAIDNNTVFTSAGSHGATYALVVSTPVRDLRVRNNVLYSAGPNTAPVSVVHGQSGVRFENNDVFAASASGAPDFGDAMHTGDLQVDPRLLSPGTAGSLASVDDFASLTNYQLDAPSPLRDAGVDVSTRVARAPATDFFGNPVPRGAAYDIGAYELMVVSTVGTFGKSSPAQGASSQGTSVTLSWEAASGATSYEYCLDTTNDNACAVWIAAGASTSVALSGLSHATIYYWQVRAHASSATADADGSSAAFWRFTTGTRLPTVVSSPASAITTLGATVSAVVNPGGTTTVTTFEYGATSTYGFSALGPTLTGDTDQAVGATLSLNCGATYHARATAENVNGRAFGSDVVITTVACPPVVTTGRAVAVDNSTTVVTGTVNSRGTATMVRVEFGMTTAYGERALMSDPGAGTAPVTVAGTIVGLVCGSTYHFRVVATNSGGTVAGEDATVVACAGIGAVRKYVEADADGDGAADLTIYRPSTGEWWTLQSAEGLRSFTSRAWGLPGDRPVPGDYDGDGRLDLAVYRPSTGQWWISWSTTSFLTHNTYGWGLNGDLPVPADYDGDGKTDLAVYRPTTGGWWILQSTTRLATYSTYGWGLAGDIPVVGDYDGDGRADPAIYRPSSAEWWVLQSSSRYGAYRRTGWGLAGDIPVAADYDGDGTTDLAIYRPTTGGWWILHSTTGFATYDTYGWGLVGDVPVAADYDGDGKADLAIYRRSTGGWWVLTSSAGFTRYVQRAWGLPGDVPASLRRPSLD